MPTVKSAALPNGFAKLEVGDLFFFTKDEKSFLGMVVAFQSDRIGQKGMVVLDNESCPVLMQSSPRVVISFGKEFTLRLPCNAEGWSTSVPDVDQPYIVVTENSEVYLHTRRDVDNEHHSVYVDIQSGHIISSSYDRFDVVAYALEWEIVTTEDEPRSIFVQKK